MKLKLFALTIIFMIFLIGLVSSFEWDNGLRYENEDLKVIIENGYFYGIGEWFGFSEDLGSAELKSHDSVERIRPIRIGNSVLMWYEFYNFSEIYLDGIGDVEIINMKNGEKVKRDYEFVYWGKTTYGIPKCDYNIKDIKEQCKGLGTRYETIEGWLPYNSRDIPKDKIIIGLRMNILADETLDLVWKLGGKRIGKHAVVSSGAVETTDGDFTILTYANNGTFNTTADITVSVLVVAGGGGASSGGGGCGEVLNDSSFFVTIGNHNIIVGTGGDGRDSRSDAGGGSQGNDGINSSFSTLNSRGGGGGGNNQAGGNGNGRPGGCGGGAGNVGGATNTGGTGDQGDGGDSFNGGVFPSGGGGGAVADGTDGTSGAKGLGGQGFFSSINGTNITYGTGGDGIVNADGVGANATGIGEGGEGGSSATNGGNGADGIVIIRFIKPSDIEVVLNSPEDNANLTSQNVAFNVSVTTNIEVQNVTLFIDGISNETNTSGINGTYIFNKIISDGSHNWSILAFNNESDSSQSNTRVFDIDSIIPDLNITFPTEIINFHEINTNLSVNWSVQDLNLDTCILQFEGVNRTVTCNDNQTQINITNSINRTIIFYANDTFGNMNSTSRTWVYLAFQHELFFNSSNFETSLQSFIINISTNSTPSSASLIYGGTVFTSATVTANSDFFNISRSINIPTSIGVKSFKFNFTVNSTEINTNSKNQTVNAINFTLCGAAPQNVPYINLTFKNETTNQESINATIISTWIYSLSSVGTINKTLSFSNSSESPLYSFCLIPSNRTINIDSIINYNNAQSQQRTFSLITALTNLTTSQVLYLLPTTLGLFSPFQVVDKIGSPLSNVKGLITRLLGASTITISSAFTDDSGFVSYFLNPEVTYTGSFSKSGFNTETFSFFPTSDTRTVILGGGAEEIRNGTNILINTTYTITPANRTLTNGTDYLFGFSVSSSQPITFISMNITSNGTSHLFVSNAGTGFISGIVNTGENSSFIGYFVIRTAEETISLASIWIIDQTFIGDYSLFKQMVLFNQYEFSDFIRLLIALCFIIGMMIFINNIGISDDSESKIAITLLLVWAFSIVGWLDTGIISSSGSSNIQALSQFSNQFGIAILSTGAGAYFILRRIFT